MTDRPFQVGSLVECIDTSDSPLDVNEIYTVVPCGTSQYNPEFVYIEDESGRYLGGWFPSRFRVYGLLDENPYTVAIREPTFGINRETTIHAMNDADAITQTMRIPNIRHGWIIKTVYGRTVASWGYFDND